MKGLIVPPLGHPVVVDGDWNRDAAIAAALHCDTVQVRELPVVSTPQLRLAVDADGKTKQLAVNRPAMGLLGDQLAVPDYVAGPVLIYGHDRHGLAVQLGLIDLLHLGTRLVAVERTALER